jgi:hypothetical protein
MRVEESGRPDSNRRFPAPEAGGLARLSHAPSLSSPFTTMCPAGVEPAHPPWHSGRLPLHHGHICRHRIVKESTGWDSNPRHRVTGAVSLPLDDQCGFSRVGPEGFEPSLAWLRARCAASNTSVPSSFIRGVDPGGVEPPSSGYRPLVLPLSHGSFKFS